MSDLFLYLDAFVTALGWTLLHFVWQGALLAGVFAVLCWFLDKARASTRYNTGVGIIVLMVLAPVLTFAAIFKEPVALVDAMAAPVTASLSVSSSPREWVTMLEAVVEASMPWAVLAWFIGVVWSGRRIYQDWRQVRALICDHVRPLPAHWQRIACDIRESCGIRVAVRVLESGKVTVPMVFGWLKPVILVPSCALLGLSHRQIELLLAHEFAHVKRLDYLVNLIQVGVETLFFYHPAVRWTSQRIRHERELCCDESVVETTGDRLTYARALAGMEELRGINPALALAASGGQLLARINRLAAAPAPQRGMLHWLVGVALLIGGAGMFNSAQMAGKVEIPATFQVIEPVEPVRSGGVALIPLTPVSPGADDLPQVAPGAAGKDRAGVPSPAAPKSPGAGQGAETSSTAISTRDTAQDSASAVVDSSVAAGTAAVDESVQIGVLASGVMQLPVAAPETGVATSEMANQGGPEPAAPQQLAMVKPEPDLVEPVSLAPGPVVSGGQLISGREPEFPRKARLRGIEGWVTVRYTIGTDGRVHDLNIVESSPRRTFDRSVRRALGTWEYEPIIVDGQAVEQNVTRTIQFRMQPGSEKFNGCAYATGTRLCRESRKPEMRDSLNYRVSEQGQ